MKTYKVLVTATVFGSLFVQAEDSEEAEEIAQEEMFSVEDLNQLRNSHVEVEIEDTIEEHE